jgi:asparagine synthase (glutamine-hydrolysing)
MCGIAGLMTRDGSTPDANILHAFEATLAHRGPDGQGRYLAGGIALVQTRLSIIDLDTGDQPMFEQGAADDQAAVLVGNGEIYNYRELRDGLADVKFATRSDCEPPLYLYRRHGLDFARHLRGMYAFAIYDPEPKRLVLSRDPFGIKPLYYVETADCFAFASEIQTLVGAGLVAPEINPSARDELFQLQFTTGAETIVANVHRLAPGETIAVEGGRIVERRTITALPAGGPQDISEEQALRRLEDALMQSVDFHQRADVPYGMFLSGGIDSSALLALMARLNDTPVRAYTAGFPGTGATDEREHARAVAEAVGAEAIDVSVTEADFWRDLPAIAAAMDDPAADYAIVPTYHGYSAKITDPLAGRHCSGRNRGRNAGANGAASRPGNRLRRLAAQRFADKGRPLFDGARP